MTDTQTPDTSTNTPGGQALSGRQIAWAAGVVMVGFILSRLMGLIREAILSGAFGAGNDYEAYLVALRLPDTLFFVVAGGALGSAFIPTFTAYLTQDRQAEGWRLASMVLNLITLILIGLAAIGALLAEPIVANILAPGFAGEPAKLLLTVQLMQIMLITPAVFGASGLLMGMLNANQRFLLPAVAPVLYNAGIIFGALALAPSMGVYGLAWGAVIGAVLHLAVQLPGVFALRARYQPILDIRDEGVREVARLMAPRVLGLAIVQVNFWVNTALASLMVTGSVAALVRAWYVMLLPQGVIAQSVANAVFPTFAVHVARGEHEALQKTLGQVLRAVLFLSLPATVGLIVLRLPVVRLLYERDAFTFEDSQATAWALLFYGLGLVFHSLLEIVTRAFYAMHDTKTPVIVGGGAMILNVVFSLALMRVIGRPGSLVMGPFAGLALANTLATMLETVALLVLIRPRVGGLEGRTMVASLARAGAASAVMGLALWALLPIIDRVGLLIGTLGAIALGGALFWGVAWVLGSDEARLFTGFVLRRLGRK